MKRCSHFYPFFIKDSGGSLITQTRWAPTLKGLSQPIITARKRSLRRFCFYTCLSFCPRGEGRAWLLGGCAWFLGEHAWLLWGGMRGCSGGCMVAPGGHAWLLGGMCGCSGECAWLLWGGHAWLLQGACVVAPGGCVVARGACMVAWGACMVAPDGYAWLLWGGHAWDTLRYRDTVNERVVHILLECILVLAIFSQKLREIETN